MIDHPNHSNTPA